jgi:hypothetical protein
MPDWFLLLAFGGTAAACGLIGYLGGRMDRR